MGSDANLKLLSFVTFELLTLFEKFEIFIRIQSRAIINFEMKADRSIEGFTEDHHHFASYRPGTKRMQPVEQYRTRIILKNLAYIIGLAPEISDEKVMPISNSGAQQI